MHTRDICIALDEKLTDTQFSLWNWEAEDPGIIGSATVLGIDCSDTSNIRLWARNDRSGEEAVFLLRVLHGANE